MINTEIKIKSSRLLSFLFLIPALLFGLISMALAIVGLGLIPLVPAVLGVLLCAVSWFLFKKSYRIFTFIVAGISMIAILMSVFRGVIIDSKVAADSDFDSSIVQAQEGIDSDLNEAFGDEGFDSDTPFDTLVAPVSSKGQELFLSKCAICHMQNGLGIENTYPPLAGSDYLKNTDKVIEIVMFGSKVPLIVNGKQYSPQMITLDLLDEEIVEVLKFVFTSWGNSLPPVTIEQVQAVRAAKKKK